MNLIDRLENQMGVLKSERCVREIEMLDIVFRRIFDVNNLTCGVDSVNHSTLKPIRKLLLMIKKIKALS